MRISSPSKCGHGQQFISQPGIGRRLTVRRNDSEPRSEQRNRFLDRGIALGLVQAVAAGLVESAERVRVEAGDVVLATERIVLEDLVGGVHGAAADDAESVWSSVMEGRCQEAIDTDWVLRPLEVKASSQTSSHQTGEVVSIDFVRWGV